jgi:hypothetical protein
MGWLALVSAGQLAFRHEQAEIAAATYCLAIT